MTDDHQRPSARNGLSEAIGKLAPEVDTVPLFIGGHPFLDFTVGDLRAALSETAASLATIKAALKTADEERMQELDRCDKEAARWEREGDMYGWNFHTGMHAGMNSIMHCYYRVRRAVEAAEQSSAQSAAAPQTAEAAPAGEASANGAKRSCTCPPDDRPSVCMEKYALNDCRAAFYMRDDERP